MKGNKDGSPLQMPHESISWSRFSLDEFSLIFDAKINFQKAISWSAEKLFHAEKV